MNKAPQFTIQNLAQRRVPGMAELEGVLDLLPTPALVLETQSRHVVAVNLKAADLIGVPRGGLLNLDIKTLFPAWDDNLISLQPSLDQISFSGTFIPGDLAEPPILELVTRSGNRQLTCLNITALPPQGKRLVINLEPAIQRKQRLAEVQRRNNSWNYLNHLAVTVQNDPLESALSHALQTASILTGINILALYVAGNNQPEWQRVAGIGEAFLLPERLHPQEITHLRYPSLWTVGKRSSGGLHRAARSNGFTYLATAPLGTPKALVGLVVAGDLQNPPPEQALPMIQYLATILHSRLEHTLQYTRLNELLEEHHQAFFVSQALESAIQQGLLVLSPDMLVLRMNNIAEAMFGYTLQEAYGQPADNILIGSEILPQALALAQQGKPTLNQSDILLYRRHGDDFLAQVSTIPVSSQDNLLGILVLVQDLTELKKFREQAQQLEQHAFLGEITAVFAHEVRNPINNITVGLELVASSLPPDDPNQENIKRMLQDCDRLIDQMKAVLSFARPTEYVMETLDVGVLLQRLLDRMRNRTNSLNIQYSLQIEQDCPKIQGNMRALEQVFNNLFNNAVQAMDESGGCLAVKVQSIPIAENHPYLEVSVADTGPGIPPEQLERVFQPFFTTKKTGTGLGLAISKRIITAHKGNISVNSFPGGTIFRLQFPIPNLNAARTDHG